MGSPYANMEGQESKLLPLHDCGERTSGGHIGNEDAGNRGNQFRRNSGGQAGGRPARYAEAFQSIFPRTVDQL